MREGRGTFAFRLWCESNPQLLVLVCPCLALVFVLLCTRREDVSAPPSTSRVPLAQAQGSSVRCLTTEDALDKALSSAAPGLSRNGSRMDLGGGFTWCKLPRPTLRSRAGSPTCVAMVTAFTTPAIKTRLIVNVVASSSLCILAAGIGTPPKATFGDAASLDRVASGLARMASRYNMAPGTPAAGASRAGA
jgi:hypothetical protein